MTMQRVANTTHFFRLIEPNRKRKFGLQSKKFGSTSSGVLQPGPAEIWRGPFRKRNRNSVCKTSRVSDVDRRTNTIHVRSPFSYDVLWQGQTKSNEGLLCPMEKGFALVSEGDGAVVRALRTEHCFVTCDAVLMFFAVPKTPVNYFLRNWNTKSFKIGKVLHFLCLSSARTVSWYARRPFVVFSAANCITLRTGCFISRSQSGLKFSAIFCWRQLHQCRDPQANIQPSGVCYKKGSATSSIWTEHFALHPHGKPVSRAYPMAAVF